MVQKKEWAIPQTFVQQFAANEYVAACWKINCNVPFGFGYLDMNGNGQYDPFGDERLTPVEVQGCGTWHKGVEGVPGDGPQANAMWHPSLSWGEDYPVYYWRDGDGTYDIHFSKVSDAQWETNPNAS